MPKSIKRGYWRKVVLLFIGCKRKFDVNQYIKNNPGSQIWELTQYTNRSGIRSITTRKERRKLITLKTGSPSYDGLSEVHQLLFVNKNCIFCLFSYSKFDNFLSGDLNCFSGFWISSDSCFSVNKD